MWPAFSVPETQQVTRLARISGVVYDSLSGGPLRGADVQLLPASGTGRARDAVTDSSGRFVLADVDTGAYLVGAFHPRLDSLGIELPPVELQVSGSDPVEMNLAVPSRRSMRTITSVTLAAMPSTRNVAPARPPGRSICQRSTKLPSLKNPWGVDTWRASAGSRTLTASRASPCAGTFHMTS
jgi:hypothetical protein